MPGLLLLQLQFGQILASLAGIEGARVVVAVPVWTDPGFSGEGGEILGQPRSGIGQAPVALTVSGHRPLRCSSSRSYPVCQWEK